MAGSVGSQPVRSTFCTSESIDFRRERTCSMGLWSWVSSNSSRRIEILVVTSSIANL